MWAATQEQMMIDARVLINMLESNFGIIQKQTQNLSHEDSLLQLPFRGNCLNWVLGHITQARNRMLNLLDQPPIWTLEQTARYARGSEPIINGDEAMRLETILSDFASAHERLLAVLQHISPEDLNAIGKSPFDNAPPRTTAEWLHTMLWHETYHTGQTEILRQLTGINDKVI